MLYTKVKLAEEAAISAFGIDRDYYFQYKHTLRVEIASVKQIAYNLARYKGRCRWRIIAEGMGQKNHSTAVHGANKCFDLISVDKDFAKIFYLAEELYLESLAKMDDN